MPKNLSHLPTIIRLLFHHQLAQVPRESPKSKSKPAKLSILSQKMSTSSNSTPPKLSLSDLITPGPSSLSSSNLATPAAAVGELVDPLQKATIGQSAPKTPPRYADVCSTSLSPLFPTPSDSCPFCFTTTQKD